MRRTWLLLLIAIALAACATGPKKRVFPPEARLQELKVEADGQWRLQLRLHNYSNVPMGFERVDVRVAIAGHDAGVVTATPAITVAANSVELLDTLIQPTAAARQVVDDALARGIGVPYQLTGTIVTSDPRGSYRQDFSSRLDRVPGLEGVLR